MHKSPIHHYIAMELRRRVITSFLDKHAAIWSLIVQDREAKLR